MTIMAAAEAEESPNFLVPNATFLVELVLFGIFFFIFARFIVPPLSRAMRERDEMVRKQAEDSQAAARRLEQAQERFDAALAEARAEGTKIRDEARAEANEIREQMRAKADAEVQRIRQQGEEQLASQREQAVQQLRSDIGGLSTELAERVVGSPVATGGSRSTVDRFLADLDTSAGSSSRGGAG